MTGFPVCLLEGHGYRVLTLDDAQARLLVDVGSDGIGQLAMDLAARRPVARVSREGGGHYRIDDPAFRGDLTNCKLFPGTALLEVWAPDAELRKLARTLPIDVGRYVLGRTGSACCAVIAGLGTLAVFMRVAPDLARSPEGASNPRWG